MTSEIFFEKFDQFVDAPNAVAKMRELVLELAMQGKLSYQDPREPPVFERERLGLHHESEPYMVPDNWMWVALQDVVSFHNGDRGKNYPSKDLRTNSGVPFINAGHLVDGAISTSSMDFISEEHFNRLSAGKVRKNDVLYCVRGSLGKAAIVQDIDRGAIASSLLILRPSSSVIPRFLYFYVASPVARLMMSRYDNGSAQPNLSASNVKKYMFPVPPLPEQNRIVTKVDELMALCDRLQALQEERDTRHVALSRAVVARFNRAPTPANLNSLFHNSYSIAPGDLRKVILNLAVQGKLVPQDPYEEPAGSLIDKISEYRDEWLVGKRAKSATRVREIDDSRSVHEIPASWSWCRLGDLVLDFRYGTSRKCSRDSGGVPVLRIPNIKGGRVDTADLKFTLMPPSEFADLQLKEGDLLIVRSNGSENLVGRSAVVTAEGPSFVYAGYLVRARIPERFVFSRYLQLALSTPGVRDQIEGPIRTTSGVKNINTTELSNLVLPLPPLEEQRRVVSKVDVLFTLVDHIEGIIVSSQPKASDLLDAIVAKLVTIGGK